MGKIMTILLIGTIAGTLNGCGGKKTDDNIITGEITEKAPSGPVRMQEYTQTKDLDWLSSTYRCEIRRTPDDSLAMVKDENGQKFVDNRIHIKVLRKDGSVFFNRTFTKADFDSFLDDDYRRTGILEGLVFDRIEGSGLVFAASVSHPQTDEYIPLVMTVSRMGNVSIVRDTQMDTSAQDDDEEI